MKKILNYLAGGLLLLSSPMLNAQTPVAAPKLPIDEETKKITYTQVVEETGTKDELYIRCIAWVNKTYKNAQEVTKVRDQANGKIQCVHRLRVVDTKEDGTKVPAKEILYTLYLEFKDGKYRYKLTELRDNAVSTSPLEKWLDKTLPSYSPKNEAYLSQIDQQIKDLIKTLKESMKPAVKKSDNW